MQTKEDLFDVNHGVSLLRIDSNLIKDIRFVHFDSSVGVNFPAEYAKQKFGKNIYWQKRSFFTPDTNLIKRIDTAITKQYCIATIKFITEGWQNTLENLKVDNDKKSLKRARKQMATQKKRFEKFCPQWQHDLIYHDRQYIGFITQDGEKIIYIQLLDFRQDPYNLKPAFSTSWIDGWHGWFETNTNRLHFHVEKGLLTINEDL
ncbi:MAG: hypothetical protein N2747_09960 [Chitinophagaceae bacterium]|nr:hypothetical protein [Chitinophagaceae bacterium]